MHVLQRGSKMKLTIPPYPRRLTLITVLFGIVVFIWLSPDEQGWLVIPLGIGMATLAAAHAVFGLRRGLRGREITGRWWWPSMVVFGGVIGTISTVTTALRMLFKSALTQHVVPDYPALVIGGVLERAPMWGIAGAL